MSRLFRDDKPVNTTHLFPSAIVCSCGDRFDSDWSTNCNHTSSALWLYLSHKAQAIASSPSTLIKPHRVICTLVSCALCAKSVGVNHYRAHLAVCRRGGDSERQAILKYRRLRHRSRVASPCFVCSLCLDDDLFHRLDIATMLEHRHGPAESHSPLGNLELYLTCRMCASGVSVDNALEHAAFAHREHLSTIDNVADMFFTVPRMQPLSRGIGEDDPISHDDDETPVYAPDCRQSPNVQHRRPLPSNGDSRNVKQESSAVSLTDNESRATLTITDVHYLDEEAVSMQLIDSLCQIGAEPTTALPCPENLTEEKSSAPPPIVTDIRREVAPPSAQLPTSTTARSATVRKDVHECDEYGQRFVRRLSLTTHQRQHTGKLLSKEVQRFECDDCGKRFNQSSALTVHNRVHTGERPFACSDCGKRFIQTSDLTVHRRMHTGERPFACSDCEKRFANSNDVRIHRRIHTGERPFACSDCDKRFIKSSTLMVHRRVHTGERPFACVECDKRFSQSSTLANHRRIHTGEQRFVCSDCGQRFNVLSSLQRHQAALHSAERPFVCSECGQRFATSGQFNRHCRKHVVGVESFCTSFTCTDCGKRFFNSRGLNMHRRVHET